MAASNVAASAFSFLAFVLITSQLGQKYQAWNTGSVSYIIWTSVMCLTVAINAIVWNDNVIDRAPAWCDISSRLHIGGQVAIPAATLCINRRLYQILTLKYQRKCAAFIVATDVFICLGIPTLCIALYYVTQVNRYLIVENVGCFPAGGEYGAGILLIVMWPLMACIASSIYSVLAVRVAVKQRQILGQVLCSDNRHLTAKRFRNLIILSLVQNIYQLAVSLFNLVPSVARLEDVSFWPGWQTVHENISFAAVQLAHDGIAEMTEQSPWLPTNWQKNVDTAIQLYIFQWTYVFHALFYFGLLGFTYEAKESYRRLLSFFFPIAQIHQSSKDSSQVVESSDMNTKSISIAVSSIPQSRTTSVTLSSLASMLFLSFGSTRLPATTSSA